MTEIGPKVDAGPAAVTASITEIAARDGISKQAVSKKVKDLIGHGLAVERNGRGHIISVNLPQYDYLRGRHDDPSKAQRPAPIDDPAPPAVDPDSYDEALRKRTWYEAERKRLELGEKIGELIRVDELAAAVDECGAEIVAIVRRLQTETDTIAAAVTRDGAHGLRVVLKQVENRMLGEIATSLDALARRAPDKPVEDAAPVE